MKLFYSVYLQYKNQHWHSMNLKLFSYIRITGTQISWPHKTGQQVHGFLQPPRLPVLWIIFIAWLSIFSSCTREETTVIIYHTNDSHAQLDNLPALAWLVEEERRTNPYVYLVSAGDIFSGNPMVDYYDPPGYPKIDIMNRAGYDLNTIGNHEFDYGPDVLNDRMEQADFPFILANIHAGSSGLVQPEPYHIIKAGPRDIAFFGLVQLNHMGIPSAHPDNLKGMEFYPPLKTAGEFDFLAGANDAVIALTHHGFVSDTLLAWEHPWIDVIIGGHSHTLTPEPRKFNDVIVTTAGSRLQHIGKVSLYFRGKELVKREAVMISMESINGHDEELASLVEEYNDNPDLNRTIGRLVRPIEGKPGLGAFITDAYREFGNFDFAFQNYGGIRVNRLEGDIVIKDIFEMDPFGNQLVSISLSYPELQKLIQNSLMDDYSPSLQMSGGLMEIHIERNGVLKQVRILDENLEELDNGRKYLTAMPSYVASAFDFDHQDPVRDMGIMTAEVIIDHISIMKEVDFSWSERSKVIIN